MLGSNTKFLDAVTLSSSQTYGPYDLKNADRASIELEIGAGLTGTFNLEESNNGTSWSTLSTAVAPSGSAVTSLSKPGALQSRYVRIRYVHGSGSGVVTGTLHTKANT